MLLPGQAKALAAEVIGKGSPILEVSGVVRDWSKMLDLGIRVQVVLSVGDGVGARWAILFAATAAC